MFGEVREWNRVSASLEKRVVSSIVVDGRDSTAYGDRGILSLCSVSRCSMSAVSGVSHPCGGGVFQWGRKNKDTDLLDGRDGLGLHARRTEATISVQT